MTAETADGRSPLPEVHEQRPTRNPLRKLYNWVLGWADTPYGAWALAALAFTESSFFPIPPDVLLIALGLSRSRRVFRYALICSVASVAGGIAGYVIGWQLFDLIGRPIIRFYSFEDKFAQIQRWLTQWDVWIVGAAGFTPIPYKVFTIASGFAGVSFLRFTLASAVSRSARFFLVSAIMRWCGEKARRFIDRYFNLLSVAFFALILIGFVVLRYLRK